MIPNVINYLIMPETEITNDWIDRYNEGLLYGSELEYFRNRLSSSPLLRAETRMDAELNQFLADDEMIDLLDKVRDVAHRERRPVSYRKTLLMAASILLFLAISSLLYYFEASRPFETLLINPDLGVLFKQEGRKTILHDFNRVFIPSKTMTPVARRKLSKQQLMANCYTPLDEYEMLAGSVTRSYSLVLVSPASGMKIHRGSPVKFEWMAMSTRPSVTIILVNNKGNQVCEAPSINAATFTLHTNELSPGLYYWKILDHDMMVLIGKLIIL